jgi:hypothetical protein
MSRDIIVPPYSGRLSNINLRFLSLSKKTIPSKPRSSQTVFLLPIIPLSAAKNFSLHIGILGLEACGHDTATWLAMLDHCRLWAVDLGLADMLRFEESSRNLIKELESVSIEAY